MVRLASDFKRPLIPCGGAFLFWLPMLRPYASPVFAGGLSIGVSARWRGSLLCPEPITSASLVVLVEDAPDRHRLHRLDDLKQALAATLDLGLGCSMPSYRASRINPGTRLGGVGRRAGAVLVRTHFDRTTAAGRLARKASIEV